MAKKEKIVDLKSKPEKITERELDKIQRTINHINRGQLEIGSIEIRKHELMHSLAEQRDKLAAIQTQMQDKYGTHDININDGTIKYEDDVEADKKD